MHGDVHFESVSFRYPSHSRTRGLAGSDAACERRRENRARGPSGAGKSTIVSLLLRFYEPDSGNVMIDGRPAMQYSLPELRGNMAIVPQEVLLFGGSIEENIRYGRPDASREEILAASRQAACHEFIERFPEGYDTVVGERGVKLSGGQRQRIAIARALLKNPSILILDEATSSLDSESEHLIQQALAVLLEDRTAFIIAHRLSTIRKVDRIYVIEDGRVLEAGTHDELVARDGGTYRRLSEMQFGAIGDEPLIEKGGRCGGMRGSLWTSAGNGHRRTQPRGKCRHFSRSTAENAPSQQVGVCKILVRYAYHLRLARRSRSFFRAGPRET